MPAMVGGQRRRQRRADAGGRVGAPSPQPAVRLKAMKITVLSHNLSSNASMRAHRLATAASTFAEVSLIGPIERSRGLWPALPQEPWIKTVRERRFPDFFTS